MTHLNNGPYHKKTASAIVWDRFRFLMMPKVGSRLFIERINNAMGAMAKGHAVRFVACAFIHRETQSSDDANVDPENGD